SVYMLSVAPDRMAQRVPPNPARSDLRHNCSPAIAPIKLHRAMDNFLLQIIVNELGQRLSGHRVGGIYQIGATDLAIDFYAPNEPWLMISTDPQRLAFYLTARNPKQSGDEPRSDTPFVALARKHLGGSRLTAAEKLGYDRVVHLEFNVRDKDGKAARRKLVV